MTIEEAIKYCTHNCVSVYFTGGRIEATDGWYRAIGVEFADVIAELKEMNE